MSYERFKTNFQTLESLLIRIDKAETAILERVTALDILSTDGVASSCCCVIRVTEGTATYSYFLNPRGGVLSLGPMTYRQTIQSWLEAMP
jgi:hypothetical protein